MFSRPLIEFSLSGIFLQRERHIREGRGRWRRGKARLPCHADPEVRETGTRLARLADYSIDELQEIQHVIRQ